MAHAGLQQELNKTCNNWCIPGTTLVRPGVGNLGTGALTVVTRGLTQPTFTMRPVTAQTSQMPVIRVTPGQKYLHIFVCRALDGCCRVLGGISGVMYQRIIGDTSIQVPKVALYWCDPAISGL